MKIKYRIWQPRDKKFHYWGFLRDGEFAGVPVGAGLTLKQCQEQSQPHINRQDINGVDIYLGDELRWVIDPGLNLTKKIEYEIGYFFLGDDHLIDVNFNEWEIIGNNKE